jgi:hypothetical protein
VAEDQCRAVSKNVDESRWFYSNFLLFECNPARLGRTLPGLNVSSIIPPASRKKAAAQQLVLQLVRGPPRESRTSLLHLLRYAGDW